MPKPLSCAGTAGSLHLLLLACPLMHVFMHGGHGDNHENGDHGSDEKKQNIQKSSPTKMINLIKENPYE